jgi:hypothetical protein
MTNNQNRVYDSFIGGFLQTDPLTMASQDPYGYAEENPILSSDAKGLLIGDSCGQPGEDAPQGMDDQLDPTPTEASGNILDPFAGDSLTPYGDLADYLNQNGLPGYCHNTTYTSGPTKPDPDGGTVPDLHVIPLACNVCFPAEPQYDPTYLTLPDAVWPAYTDGTSDCRTHADCYECAHEYCDACTQFACALKTGPACMIAANLYCAVEIAHPIVKPSVDPKAMVQ